MRRATDATAEAQDGAVVVASAPATGAVVDVSTPLGAMPAPQRFLNAGLYRPDVGLAPVTRVPFMQTQAGTGPALWPQRLVAPLERMQMQMQMQMQTVPNPGEDRLAVAPVPPWEIGGTEACGTSAPVAKFCDSGHEGAPIVAGSSSQTSLGSSSGAPRKGTALQAPSISNPTSSVPAPPPGYPKALGPNRGLPIVRKGAYVFPRVRKLVISLGEKLMSSDTVVRDSIENLPMFVVTSKLLSAHWKRTVHDAKTMMPLLTVTSEKVISASETMFIEDAFGAPGKEPMMTLKRVSRGLGKGRIVQGFTPRKRRDPAKERNLIRKPPPPPPALTATPRANARTLRVADTKSNHVADVVRNTAGLKSISTARVTYFVNVSSGYDCALLTAVSICLNEQFA